MSKNSEAVIKHYERYSDKKKLKKKKTNIRNYLRKRNILPKYGEPLNDEQQRIWTQISENDFSYYEKIREEYNKTKRTHPKELEDNRRLARRLYECRKYGILPAVGVEMNENEQEIYDYLVANPRTPIKSFMRKYIDKTTPEYNLWYRANKSANKRGHEFNLEVKDIMIPEYCPYLNIKLTTDFRSQTQANYYSIDRINPNKGYVKGNVQVISRLANTMKSYSNIDELKTFAQNVLKLHS